MKWTISVHDDGTVSVVAEHLTRTGTLLLAEHLARSLLPVPEKSVEDVEYKAPVEAVKAKRHYRYIKRERRKAA